MRDENIRIKSEMEKWDKYYSCLPLLDEDDFMREFNNEFAEKISELLPAGSKILEAGCGAGWQSLALAKLGKYDIALMDFSQAALSYAQKLFSREGLQATFIYGDVLVPGEPEYDLVFNAGVLEHYAPNERIAFLKAMASRSRKYVMVLVPNRQCYWYWIWRIQKASMAEWPFGKEVPSTDLSEIFRAAGLNFIGQMPLGESWTEAFINDLSGINEDIKKQLIEIHRSPLIPKVNKGYLMAALGSTVHEVSDIPSSWRAYFKQDKSTKREDELIAALGDALALSLGAEQKLKQLQAELVALIQQVQTLQVQLQTNQQREQKLLQSLSEREKEIEELRKEVMEKEAILQRVLQSKVTE